MSILHRMKNVDYKVHLILAFGIRVILIAYGMYHDKHSVVPYTDIDYKVFSDAARYVTNFESPYKRHTYRYSPLLAILMIPNVLIHECSGKFIFSIVDILVGYLIKVIVQSLYKSYWQHTMKTKNKVDFVKNSNINNEMIENRQHKQGRLRKKNKSSFTKNLQPNKEQKEKIKIDTISNLSMCIWLYNPLTIAIATRGNSDSIAGLLVLSVLYYMQIKKSYFLAGLLHGIAIHLRLYPIVYSLTLFMHISKFSYYNTENRHEVSKHPISNYKPLNSFQSNDIIKKSSECTSLSVTDLQRKTIFKKEYLLYLLPNTDQLKLISGCLLSLFALTTCFFFFYGNEFLYETYIFHLIRTDSRHNFSLYFYLQYLTAGIKTTLMWQKSLTVLPKIVLLFVLSVRYGLNKYALNFSILAQTFVIVIYNTVLTSQYFIWILCLLPLCIWQINLNITRTISLFTLWFTAQAAWLLPAYFLEFQGYNTFFLIWLQSVSLFCAHIAILGRLTKYFIPLSSHDK